MTSETDSASVAAPEKKAPTGKPRRQAAGKSAAAGAEGAGGVAAPAKAAAAADASAKPAGAARTSVAERSPAGPVAAGGGGSASSASDGEAPGGSSRPPTIEPKTKPRPVGGSSNVRRVGHSDGDARTTHGGAGLTPGSHGPRRSYRTGAAGGATTAVGGVVPETAAFGVHRPGGAAADAAHSGLAEPPGGAGAGVPRGRPKRSSIGVAAAGGAVAAAGAAAGGARMVGPGGVEARVEPAGSAKQARKQGRIKLNLSYVAPLSVMKIAFLVAVALGIAFAVVVFILWEALDEKAVFTTIDDMITEVVGANRPEWLNILDYLERGRIMSGAAVIAVINVVIITVVSTLLAVIYNIVAALVGGVHVTLKED